MITSTSNEKVKMLIRLGKKAKERKEAGVFLIEGVKLFEEAPKHWIKEVYVSESFDQHSLPSSRYKHYHYEVLADRVFSSISDTKTPQGILALIKIPNRQEQIDYNQENGLFLFLEDIQDPGNLGTMIRTGEGAGVSAVILSKSTVDLYNPKTIRSTMGSIYRVPVIIAENFAEEIIKAKNAGVNMYAAHLDNSSWYDLCDYSTSTGFLIGNEGKGLSKQIADLSDAYIKIPMEGKVESLNAAIAATLLMYEVSRQRRK